MEEWGRPAQQPRTPLPPRRSVPPPDWWEPTERCPGGPVRIGGSGALARRPRRFPF